MKHLPEFINNRRPETSKRDYGHALLIAGSHGKMGAALLSAKACLRSGAGLVTAHIPSCGLDILQSALPEAMAGVDSNDRYISHAPHNLHRYQAVGIGPGIGTEAITQQATEAILDTCGNEGMPVVIDADALNIVAMRQLHHKLPAHSIITPHAAEYERLFGTQQPEEMSRQHNIIIVKKSHRTRVYAPDGSIWNNSTGNAGMATAGSGDVLTGIILGLLAQGLTPFEAACTGIYLHGLAGDKAAECQNQASIIASDLIEQLKWIHK